MGLFFTVLQFASLAMMVYASQILFFYSIFTNKSPLVLQVMCVLSCAITRTVLVNLFTFIYRTNAVIKCLNNSSNVISSIEADTKMNAYKVLLLGYFTAIPASFAIFVRFFSGGRLSIIIPSLICNLQENAIIFLLIMFFTIVELSLADINTTIRKVNETCTDILSRLECLMVRHWLTCELFDELSNVFGLDVVLLCWYNLVKVVFLSYYSYFMLVTNHRDGTGHIVTSIDVPYRFFIIWFLGYKCDKISKQKTESRTLLAELLVERNNKLDEAEKATIKVFLRQIHSRGDGGFTASGLFVLNRAKLYNMLQMAVTYIVVLAQFHSFM